MVWSLPKFGLCSKHRFMMSVMFAQRPLNTSALVQMRGPRGPHARDCMFAIHCISTNEPSSKVALKTPSSGGGTPSNICRMRNQFRRAAWLLIEPLRSATSRKYSSTGLPFTFESVLPRSPARAHDLLLTTKNFISPLCSSKRGSTRTGGHTSVRYTGLNRTLVCASLNLRNNCEIFIANNPADVSAFNLDHSSSISGPKAIS
mmetsp:Transcript_134925/g.349621  ORF Transcript_134925/g.349621 Transcript_134925/m.349621 type:complete len:203 (-) Transcript_134925:384-992(-)